MELFRADPADAANYHEQGWWGNDTVGSLVASWQAVNPDGVAFIADGRRYTWAEYHVDADDIARALLAGEPEKGERIAVMMPDGPAVHAVFVGIERAGCVAVGIGARAGDREVAHLLSLTGARTLITAPEQHRRDAASLRADVGAMGVTVDRHLLVGLDARVVDAALPEGVEMELDYPQRPIHPDELFLLNSTSGTTGLPKCVMHTQNRWFYFHKLAATAGGFSKDEVFFGALPAPFGFGLWTAHFTPTALGAPTVVMDRFDADEALDLIERERVTVLCCVSTQFIMLLNAQAERPRDLSSLRSMFTGGEAVPYERAAEFEETTGAKVLQFYGSNETGALSHTSYATDKETRLRTAGHVIPEMHVRLLNPETFADVPRGENEGQPACKGPATGLGYWGDQEANTKLFTEDGWMLMGDIVRIDDDGVLSVIGRTSDFIIRGGKNISAPAVEAELATHSSVAMVAAVAFPDPVFGERVCAYVELRPDTSVTLEELVEHMRARSVSREWWPEHLVIVDELPRSSGGKVAKGDLKADAKLRSAELHAKSNTE
ncbi:MAG: class I adenylate-forming enzyme family protein [Actinobacteria bacterium]|nr:class I adenylate-forming enzyme family protein [Actinomycetota bacterium]